MILTNNYGKMQLLADLEGTENLSLTAEAYVLVKDGKLWADGKQIPATAEILIELWDKECAGALYELI